MCTRIQKKGAVTPQETQTFHECPRVSGGALVQQWPAVRVGALKEVAIIFLAAAAAAAKSLQSCPTLCDPIDGGPPGFSVHGIFQARVLEWVAIAFSDYLPYFHHILPQVNKREGTQLHPSTEN